MAERDFPGLEARGWRGALRSHRTATIRHRAGPSAFGVSVLSLDWHGDGRASHDYTAPPTV
ncbi:hypothetical protein ACFQ9Q_27765 [Streptomyces virginiae]|uniref:hypothetical protein n=1 Tax=Streptomyces virginiae TaxID=1961 RepID=UPI0036A2AFD0